MADAGTVACDDSLRVVEHSDRIRCPVAVYEITWTADGAGVVTGTTRRRFSGEITRVVTVPGATVAETYALALKDQHGIDMLNGAVTAASATLAEEWFTAKGYVVNAIQYPMARCVDGPLTINITSVTAGSSGSIFVYMR